MYDPVVPKEGRHPFEYHQPSPAQVEQIRQWREGCKALHAVMLEAVPAGPDRTLAFRLLQDCMMRGNCAIVMADEGPVAA